MVKIDMVIVDVDERYIKGVRDYFNKNYSDRFNVSYFSSAEELKKELDGDNSFEILIINKDIYFEELKSYNIKTKIIFSDSESQGEFEGLPIISKYISAKVLYDIVLKLYTDHNQGELEKLSEESESKKIITFYSPVGGSGKTTLAVNLAKELASSGSKVLYLNLEDVQTTNLYFKSDKENTLSDLLLALKEKRENLKDDLANYLSKDNNSAVYFYKSTEGMLDIEEIDKKDIRTLFENLKKIEMFNLIIVDTSSKINVQYRELLECSNEIVVPFGMDQISTEKLSIFINEIKDIEKYTFLINKSVNDIEYKLPEVLRNKNKGVEGGIPYDNNLQFNDSLDTSGGMVMKCILQSLITKFNLA